MPDEGREATPDDNTCDRCPAFAPWSIQNFEGNPMQPITRWFACNRHLAMVLRFNEWEVDTVQVMYLDPDSERDL